MMHVKCFCSRLHLPTNPGGDSENMWGAKTGPDVIQSGILSCLRFTPTLSVRGHYNQHAPDAHHSPRTPHIGSQRVSQVAEVTQ